MSFVIGKCNIGTDGYLLSDIERRGNILSFDIVTDNSNIVSELREIFKQSGKILESERGGRTIYIDKSPFKTNTVYVQLDDVYSGWAIFTGIIPEYELCPGTYQYSITLCMIDDDDLANYTMAYECEDYNIEGTDTSDHTCSNNEKVVYTPDSTPTKIIEIADLNLPSGDYGIYIHTYSNTTKTVTFKGKNSDLDGSYTGNVQADRWEIVNLGTFPISDTSTGLEIWCYDSTNTNDVEFDLIWVKRENYTGQYRFHLDTGALG